MNSAQLGSGNAMDEWMGFKTPTLNTFGFACEKRRSHAGKRIEDRKRAEVFTAFMDQPSDPIGGETRRVSVPAMDGEGHIVPERPLKRACASEAVTSSINSSCWYARDILICRWSHN